VSKLAKIYSFISKQFKGHTVLKLVSLIEPLKQGKTIPKGTLVVMASGDAKLRLKILDRDTPHKGFSTPLKLKKTALEKGITSEYLLWYLGQAKIADELMKYATGSVILRVPKSILEAIPVPIPRKQRVWPINGDVILKKEKDDFSCIIKEFYEDFRLNVKYERYRIAIIIAGAICEAMLFKLLIDAGVEKKLLEEDRQLGLGRLIKYVKLLKLDKEFHIPVNHIQEIQKKRNIAIHIGSSTNFNEKFISKDVSSFDQVVKYFGL